jgi:peptidyl-prolyl cis-trans isomerase B (cyclophilin B)
MAEAIRAEVPPNALPPATTLTGKSVGKLYAEVEKLWPAIRFVNADGRKLQYTAVVETELGKMEIRLLPDLAPNHVRSFIALAKAGYYDGLLFETREGDALGKDVPRLIAGGSPEGDGNDMGSVGYWLVPEILKPEVAAQRGVKHQPGSVGMRRGLSPDTAGCRFYITLMDAPMLDGEFTIFGQVTRGLEVAERIFAQPVHEGQDLTARFVKPPRIEGVRILAQPLEKGEAKPDNDKR